MSRVRYSNSSNSMVGFIAKIVYNFNLFIMRLRTNRSGSEVALERIAEIQNVVKDFESVTGRKASQSNVVEIGFGARPERAFAMSAFFNKVTAIDLDAPLQSVDDIPRIFRNNGFERGLKSAIRHSLFDARGWRLFHGALHEKFPGYNPRAVHFIIGDAASDATWKDIGEVHLVFSQDVFEHIPFEGLQKIMSHMRERLADDGLVMTRPMVFTGISGGHDLQWYPHSVESGSSKMAWNHVLDPNFNTNTYLNKMNRRSYIDLFRDSGFRILRDHATLGRLGERHLTEELRAALSSFDNYELFSNQVEIWAVRSGGESRSSANGKSI